MIFISDAVADGIDATTESTPAARVAPAEIPIAPSEKTAETTLAATIVIDPTRGVFVEKIAERTLAEKIKDDEKEKAGIEKLALKTFGSTKLLTAVFDRFLIRGLNRCALPNRAIKVF